MIDQHIDEHASARLALADMVEALPEDYDRTALFLGIPFWELSRLELYVVIRYAEDMGNLKQAAAEWQAEAKQWRDKLTQRRPWWKFW